MFRIPTLLCSLIALSGLVGACVWSQTQHVPPDASRPTPSKSRYPRTAPNLERNHEVRSAFGWTLSRGAAYDGGVSRRRGSGSLNLSALNSQVQSELIPVKPGKTYTFSAYMRSSVWPVSVYMMVAVYDAAGRFKYNFSGSSQITTAADTWQEIVAFFPAKEGDAGVRLVIGRPDKGKSPEDGGHIWIDDVYFGEGMSFEQPPVAHKAFDGSKVRIDSLGNFEVFKKDAWKPFFLFGIYPDSNRKSYQVYSDQGFNCIMFGLLFNKGAMQLAKDAVSKYNPDGMMTVVEIANYTTPGNPAYDKVEEFTNKMTEMLRSPVSETLLMYYWDNEQYNQYAVPKRITDTIRKLDVDSNGKRMHPIYMNHGNQGLARAFAPLVDTVGDYLRDPYRSYPGHEQSTAQRFAVLNNVEKQSAPVSIGIISEEETAAGVRRQVYEGLIAGMKGIAYYRDGVSTEYYNGDMNGPGAKDVTQRVFWNEWPKLHDEIDQLLPLIRQPTWTAWKLSASPPGVVFGTRDYRNEGHVILLNPTPRPVTAAMTLTGLPYKAEQVMDYFTGTPVTKVAANRFTVSLKGNSTAVYRLAK